MLKLHQGFRTGKLPNLSPACVKLETWLRMTGIAYELAPADLDKAPKGKIPFIEHDGRAMGDSTLIVDYLVRTTGIDPDAHLTKVERAVALAFRRMLKENFYWVIGGIRYDEQNWSSYKEGLREAAVPGLPREVQEHVLTGIQSGVVGQMQAQGMGRHTRDEVNAIGIADLGAVADFLGDKPFFMGDRPSTVDATVYAYVASLLWLPLPSPVRDYGLGRENLVAFCERMHQKYFPELR
jgi:glutathione S-transferase